MDALNCFFCLGHDRPNGHSLGERSHSRSVDFDPMNDCLQNKGDTQNTLMWLFLRQESVKNGCSPLKLMVGKLQTFHAY